MANNLLSIYQFFLMNNILCGQSKVWSFIEHIVLSYDLEILMNGIISFERDP